MGGDVYGADTAGLMIVRPNGEGGLVSRSQYKKKPL